MRQQNDPEASELPPLPVQRGAAVAERDRQQLGEPVAAVGAAEEERQLVADKPVAAASEERGPADQTAHPVLLAAAGRDPNKSADQMLTQIQTQTPRSRRRKRSRRTEVGSPNTNRRKSG